LTRQIVRVLIESGANSVEIAKRREQSEVRGTTPLL